MFPSPHNHNLDPGYGVNVPSKAKASYAAQIKEISTLPCSTALTIKMINMQFLKGKSLRWGITISAGSCYLLFGYDQVRGQPRLI